MCFFVRMVTLDLYTADVQLLRACASGKDDSVNSLVVGSTCAVQESVLT